MKISDVRIPKERKFTLTLPSTLKFLHVEAVDVPNAILRAPEEGLDVILYYAHWPSIRRTRKYTFLCVMTGRSDKRLTLSSKFIGHFTSPLSGRDFFLFVVDD